MAVRVAITREPSLPASTLGDKYTSESGDNFTTLHNPRCSDVGK